MTETATPWQLFNALPAHIEDALRASIERFGVLVPWLRAAEPLSAEEIRDRAVRWLQEYTPSESGQWRQGNCTTPRRDDGTPDEAAAKRLFEP